MDSLVLWYKSSSSYGGAQVYLWMEFAHCQGSSFDSPLLRSRDCHVAHLKEQTQNIDSFAPTNEGAKHVRARVSVNVIKDCFLLPGKRFTRESE